jgi:hypothetical protein
MAKRVRGTTSRPGQRPPLQRSTRSSKPSGAVAKPAPTTGAVAPPPDSLTADEEARAAELEAAIVAEERQAEDSRRRFRTSRSSEAAAAPRPASSLDMAAAEEYGYVARDVRRIAIVGGGLVTLLIVLWVIARITGFVL